MHDLTRTLPLTEIMARGKAKQQRIDLDNLDTLARVAGDHNPSPAVLAKCQELGLPTYLNPKQRRAAIAELQQNNRRAERRNRTVGHAYLRIEPMDNERERSDEESDFRRQRRLAREAENLRFAKERLKQRREAREDKAADEADDALAALAINHVLEQFRSLTPPPESAAPKQTEPRAKPVAAADDDDDDQQKLPVPPPPPTARILDTFLAPPTKPTKPPKPPTTEATMLNGWAPNPPPPPPPPATTQTTTQMIKIPSTATAPKKKAKAKVGKKEKDDLRKTVATLQRQLFQNANWMIQMHSTMQQLATRHEQTHAALIYANRRIAALEKKAR